MKKKGKVLIAAMILVCMAASFWMGSYVQKRENRESRVQRCAALISFALAKTENEDISDPGVMKALISNVYAAYWFCDEPKAASQLHDLWNMLIFEGDDTAAVKEILRIELNGAAERIRREIG